MIVHCMVCGAKLERNHPRKMNFCCLEHRNLWMSEHVNFSELSRGHKARHLTKLNKQRNPYCHIGERGKPNSKRSRQAAEKYLGRELVKGEVVHHMNGDTTDNNPDNLLVMTDKQHKQLHMALAIESMEGGDDACLKN